MCLGYSGISFLCMKKYDKKWDLVELDWMFMGGITRYQYERMGFSGILTGYRVIKWGIPQLLAIEG